MKISKESLKGLIEVIDTISDVEFQKRVWVEGKGLECSSWEEVMCQFDDYNVPYIYSNPDYFLLTKAQEENLRFLWGAIEAYSNATSENMEPTTVLADPRWIEIQHFAKNTVVAFEGHPLIRRKN